MSDREATQVFAMRSTLISRCGQILTPSLIEKIVKEMEAEMTSGPCSWAFKPLTLTESEGR
jgi:hypothetical protein